MAEQAPVAVVDGMAAEGALVLAVERADDMAEAVRRNSAAAVGRMSIVDVGDLAEIESQVDVERMADVGTSTVVGVWNDAAGEMLTKLL